MKSEVGISCKDLFRAATAYAATRRFARPKILSARKYASLVELHQVDVGALVDILVEKV